MKLRKATALCAAAMMSCTMLSTADANAFRSVSLPAVAEEEAWTLSDDGTLTISQNIRGNDIPWADQLDKIKKVVAADEVYLLPSRAFEGCTNLKTVKLSAACDELYSDVFKDCTTRTAMTCSLISLTTRSQSRTPSDSSTATSRPCRQSLLQSRPNPQ